MVSNLCRLYRLLKVLIVSLATLVTAEISLELLASTSRVDCADDLAL